MIRRLPPLLATLGLAVAACGGGTASSPAPSKNAVEFGSCMIGPASARCATLHVPEDRSKPNGRQLDLRVAVVPAESETPQPDPVFMLAGGPGGAATEVLAWTPSVFKAIHANRDIVLVDQRGTGASRKLLMPDDGGDPWAALDADARMYTTSVAMDDLDDVRAALGYDRINVWGGSYGATAAQYYAKQHESHVRSIVLDGATLLDVPIFELIPRNTQRALDGVFARCEADSACHAAFPNVRDEYQTVLTRLAAKPATATFNGENVTVDANVVASGVQQLLITADTSARVPALVHLAYLERWDEVAAASSGASGGGSDSLVMSLVIRCSEAWARWDVAEMQQLSAGSWQLPVQTEAARRQATMCAAAPRGVVPADDDAPLRTSLPVLLTVGALDPQDPPENIADARVELPNSQTVVAPGHGHTVSHLPCMSSIVEAFIERGSVEGLDTSCVDRGEVTLPPFVVSG